MTVPTSSWRLTLQKVSCLRVRGPVHSPVRNFRVHSGPGVAWIGVGNLIPCPPAVAPETDVGAFLGEFFDLLRVQIGYLVPVRPEHLGVAAETTVLDIAGFQGCADLRPRSRQAHDLVRKFAVTAEASMGRIEILAQDEACVAPNCWSRRRRARRIFPRVLAEVTEVARQAHHLLGVRCDEMAAMKRFLLSGIGVERLVPSQYIVCFQTCRRL